MFENPKKGRQARNFTTTVPQILDTAVLTFLSVLPSFFAFLASFFFSLAGLHFGGKSRLHFGGKSF